MQSAAVTVTVVGVIVVKREQSRMLYEPKLRGQWYKSTSGPSEHRGKFVCACVSVCAANDNGLHLVIIMAMIIIIYGIICLMVPVQRVKREEEKEKTEPDTCCCC